MEDFRDAEPADFLYEVGNVLVSMQRSICRVI